MEEGGDMIMLYSQNLVRLRIVTNSNTIIYWNCVLQDFS